MDAYGKVWGSKNQDIIMVKIRILMMQPGYLDVNVDE
jgi:hypothetical protein